MRRILIDRARAKAAQKRGGDLHRVEFEELEHPAAKKPEKLLHLDEALTKLEATDPQKAQLVKLRFFGGLTNAQAASALGISAGHRRSPLGFCQSLAESPNERRLTTRAKCSFQCVVSPLPSRYYAGRC